jgi:hypothetical protein
MSSELHTLIAQQRPKFTDDSLDKRVDVSVSVTVKGMVV